jgi:hypothetical protein
VEGLWIQTTDFEFRVQGSGHRVQGIEFGI